VFLNSHIKGHKTKPAEMGPEMMNSMQNMMIMLDVFHNLYDVYKFTFATEVSSFIKFIQVVDDLLLSDASLAYP
jgi:hypothetical protein